MPTPNFYYDEKKYRDLQLLSRHDFFANHPDVTLEEYENTLDIFIEERR